MALLAGRREIARSRGRSLLILLLIGLPVFGLAAAGVLLASLNANPAEDADQSLGQAVALVAPADQPQTGEFAYSDSVPTANGGVFGEVISGGYASWEPSHPDEVRVAKGYTADEPWTSERVEATVGAPVVRTAIVPLTSIDGAETADLSETSVVVADASDPRFAGRGQLVSGRWATGPGEVTVTEVGVQMGLPRSGTVSVGLGTVSKDGLDPGTAVTTQVRVVGVGRAAGGQFGSAVAVINPADAPPDTPWSYLVDRAEPVGLAEAVGWSDYGLSVMSRAVLLDPPPEVNDSQSVLISLIIAMMVFGVVIETMFLAGPAFAISTTARQRSMALASAQGAGPADLRRQVLAYAVVLASVAAVLGAVLGIGSGLAVAAYLRHENPRNFLPLEVPWLPLLGIVALAVCAAGVAAWWPARSVTHLDTMAVLRGRSVSRKVKPGMPVFGAVLVASSVVLAVFGAQIPSGGEYSLVAAAAGAFFGVVLLIPWLLFRAGRLADHLPLAARLATRDATRQRGRSVPAVAAIVAATALVAGLSTVVASDAEATSERYQPLIEMGTATVSLEQFDEFSEEPTSTDPDTVTTALERAVPDVEVWEVGYATAGQGIRRWSQPGPNVTGTLWATYPPDCSRDHVELAFYGGACALGPSTYPDSMLITVMPVGALARTGGLDEAGMEAFRDGTVLVGRNVAPGAMRHTTTGLPTLSGPVRTRTSTEDTVLEPRGELVDGTIEAYVLTDSEMAAVRPGGDPGLIMSPGTADSLGLAVEIDQVQAAMPDRAFTEGEASAASEALDQLNIEFYVERGYAPDDNATRAIWVVLTVLGLIALAATVIVTALATTDNARDSGVLAAVGGTTSFRRRWACWYAVVTSCAGVTLGLAVGLGIGAACGWWTTLGSAGTDYGFGSSGGPVIALFWPALGALALLPLVGAAIAYVSVRKTPTLLRPTI